MSGADDWHWFSKPDNAQRVGQHLIQVMGGFLELTDDGRIQRLLKRAVHKAIDKVDFTETSAVMLESMTKTTAIRYCWTPSSTA